MIFTRMAKSVLQISSQPPFSPAKRNACKVKFQTITAQAVMNGACPCKQWARAFLAYFLGVISAGRYREISIPADTWHIVGFVQLFFMSFSFVPAPKADSFDPQPLPWHLCAMVRP
jgi:hypothetical protein